jgi:hypothetical protein
MPMNMNYIAWAGYDLTCCGQNATVSGICDGSGYIQLEFGWQLIAIPVIHGYWDDTTHAHVHDDVTVAKFENYVLDQIEDLYTNVSGTTVSGVEEIVEVANTYTGDEQAFFSYVVGSTPTGSPHNFQLVYDDVGYNEISGFWIKIINAGAPYNITWGEQ